MTRRQKVAGAVGLGAFVLLLGWLLMRSQPEAPERRDPGNGAGPVTLGTAPTTGPAPTLAGQLTVDGGTAHATQLAGHAEVLARFGWGSGDDALGRERQPEGNPEGPMSLAVGPDGSIFVLDQVNQRLVRLDAKGKRVSSTPLPLQAAQDVVVTKDGTALVMDRLVDKAVAVIGPDGKQKGELPLEGKGLTEGGASTGLFHDGDDVLVEREHGDLVRLGKSDGTKDTERGEVPGRPTKDGASYLTAVIVDPRQGLFSLTAIAKTNLEHRYTRQVSFGQPIETLVMLDSDAAGLAYVGAHVELPGSTLEVPRLGVVVLCLDGRDGATLGRTSFPANAVADESFRELSVAGDGSILFLRRTTDGAQLERHRCQ
jgi:hypothetical protein